MTYSINFFSTHPTKLYGPITYGGSSTPRNSSPTFWLSSMSTTPKVDLDDKIIDVLTINVFTNASALSSFHKSS